MDEERIGNYRVHPAAALFPLLAETAFDELVDSIRDRGQLVPILVQGDVLLDGRNRLRGCLKLGIDPRVEEYTGALLPSELIEDLNMIRRDLTDDQRTMIAMQLYSIAQKERAALKQKAAGAAQGHHGTEGGRGHKKPPTVNSSEGVSEPKTRARDARSTVGQIATATKVSHHKAAQAVAVGKHSPELADKVVKGEMKLRDAAKVAQERKPRKPAPLKAKQPANLDAGGIATEFRRLRAGIAERRKAAHAERYRRNWNNDAVLKIELERLIQWVETELDKIAAAYGIEAKENHRVENA